ncbi:olfactory receptor 6F1-like [Hemicordylus capensis]|uniref:olfactory receptor 6F1-like n=1 Tax=Hemicordylus capensis TaxID=884348 RepID=UPI002303E60B|nr:olfactory receptor 6F1-like [Hemicordylus capensis]
MGEHNQGGQNETTVTEFILLGFPGSLNFKMFIFSLFLIMYILSVAGNLSIIILVVTTSRLHTPMYFFLCSLSFVEIWYTTNVVPKALAIFLGRSRSISFSGCILQMYFAFSFGITQHFLLTVMAYDRYLAICYPLHYSTIMDIKLACKLVVGCWICGFLSMSILAYLISRLSFCGPNVINHFFCNIDSWIVLSCSDTRDIEILVFALSIIVILCTFAIILLSYMYIISTILHIPSAKGQQKAFSTCLSHLAIVIILYGSTIFLYVKPSKQTSLEMTKIVNILNAIVTPFLNPFIYTLRNKEVKEALRNALHWR